MTSDSPESSRKHILELHRKHRRATRAMLNHIVLRSPEANRGPDLQADSIENDIRTAIWSREHEIAQLDPDYLQRPNVPRNLAETMAGSCIETLATPGKPLTKARLRDIDPGLLTIAERNEESGINWPDDETVFHDVLPDDYDDFAFAHKLVQESSAYNNFPAMISTVPSRPAANEDYVDFMYRTKFFQYATKPYLARAHALQPDFMQTLQSTMSQVGSAQEWRRRLMGAADDEDADPEDRVLLRASRLSYQLLINLMRKDDLNTQSRLSSMSYQQEITNPLTELWT